MPPALFIIVGQIRGPGVIGPTLQIRGPGVGTLATGLPEVVKQAERLDQGPVAILIANNWVEIAELSGRWPGDSDPGWLVDTAITSDELKQALAAAPQGPLRILVAADTAVLASLSLAWGTN
jgi:hypothetical protein